MNAHLVDKRLFSGLYSRLARSRRTHTSSSLSKDKQSSDSKTAIISTRSKHSDGHAEERGYINLDEIPVQPFGEKPRGNTTPKQNLRSGITRSSDLEQGYGGAEPHGEAR